MADELAALSEGVREAMDAVTVSFMPSFDSDAAVAWRKCRDALVILARENAELRTKVAKGVFCANQQIIREWQGAEAERDEARAELAALRHAHQGVVQAVRPQADGNFVVEVRCDSAGVASLFAKRVALPPLDDGGEG